MYDQKKTAERIRYLRTERYKGDEALSQKQAAQILGISQSRYSQIEQGNCRLRVDHLIKLCVFYHVSADYILGFTDDESFPETPGYKAIKRETNNLARDLKKIEANHEKVVSERLAAFTERMEEYKKSLNDYYKNMVERRKENK